MASDSVLKVVNRGGTPIGGLLPGWPLLPNVTTPVKVSARLIDDYSPAQLGFGQIPPPPENQAGLPHRELLYLWYDRMPEIRGAIAGMVDDIFGGGYTLQGSDARVKKVKKFCNGNRFDAKMHAVARDYLITGDGYLGKSAVNEAQVIDAIQNVYKRHMMKAASFDDIQYHMCMAKAANPDLYSTKVLFPIKSRSVRIDYTMTGEVVSYVQQTRFSSTSVISNGDINTVSPYSTAGATPGMIRFKPEEVIHFAYEPVGDDVYGTSWLLPAIWDITSMWYAKNYGGKFFENDATPSRLWNLPDEVPGSDNYNNFCTELQKHKRSPNRNLVTTGNLTSEPITTANKDLAFGDFIDRYMKHILMSGGMSSKYFHLFGGKGENNEMREPYFKKINVIQGELEETLNAELFEDFDVEFEFEHVYKRDESREADIVNKLVGRPVMTINEGRTYLGYDPTDNPADNEIAEVLAPSNGGNNATKTPKSENQTADARRSQSAENPSSQGRPKSKY